MKIDKKYLGKWVVIKNDKVIATNKSLKKLTEKFTDEKGLSFTLVPKGLISC